MRWIWELDLETGELLEANFVGSPPLIRAIKSGKRFGRTNSNGLRLGQQREVSYLGRPRELVGAAAFIFVSHDCALYSQCVARRWVEKKSWFGHS